MSISVDELKPDSRPKKFSIAYLQSRRLAMAFGLLLFLHSPTLLAYGRGLAGRDHYQFFPVVWIALVVLVVSRSSSAIVPRWYQAALLLIDVCLLTMASTFRSEWLGFAGFCAGCLALLAAGRDKVTGRSLWPLILLPLLTLRPPLNLDIQIITRLQLATTHAASLIIDGMGVLHYRRGAILELPSRELFIDQACSGIQSLFTLLGLAALIILIHRRHWLASLLLLVSAIVWAVLLNVVRVVIIVLANWWWNIDLASGWQHDVLGYVLVTVALICLLSTDRLLLLLTSRIPEQSDIEQELGLQEPNPLVRSFNWFFRLPSAVRVSVPAPPRSPQSIWQTMGLWQSGALLFLGAAFVTAQLVGLQPRLQATPGSVRADLFSEKSLAGVYDDWMRGEYRIEVRSAGNMWGERSFLWHFSRGLREAQVSVDYWPEGWHELTICYENAGWKVTSREVRRFDADWSLVVVVMQDEAGQYGILCFSDFDGDGRPVASPGDRLFTEGVAQRWRRASGRAIGAYQVQAFSTILTPPSEVDVEPLVRLHCQTRRDLARRFSSGTN